MATSVGKITRTTRDIDRDSAQLSNPKPAIKRARGGARAHSPSPQAVTRAREAWRRKRIKYTKILMLATLVIVCLGITLVSIKLAQLSTLSRRILITQSANRAVEARVDNLSSEMLLETRADIVRHKAMAQLNMVVPSESETRQILLTRSKDARQSQVALAERNK